MELSLFLTEAKESHLSLGEKSALVKFVILFKSHNTTAERNGNKYSRTARMNKLGAYRNIDTCGKQLVLIANSKSANDAAKFPHSPILHYAYSPLLEENNSANNRLPLGLFALFSRESWCLPEGTARLYPGRDTFEFDQGHVIKNQPITVLVLLSESLGM